MKKESLNHIFIPYKFSCKVSDTTFEAAKALSLFNQLCISLTMNVYKRAYIKRSYKDYWTIFHKKKSKLIFLKKENKLILTFSWHDIINFKNWPNVCIYLKKKIAILRADFRLCNFSYIYTCRVYCYWLRKHISNSPFSIINASLRKKII